MTTLTLFLLYRDNDNNENTILKIISVVNNYLINLNKTYLIT